jgi:hypothetical protein
VHSFSRSIYSAYSYCITAKNKDFISHFLNILSGDRAKACEDCNRVALLIRLAKPGSGKIGWQLGKGRLLSVTLPQAKESYSFAHIAAIASRASVNIAVNWLYDLGIDGSFRQVIRNSGGSAIETGVNLEFQLKARTKCTQRDDHMVFDLFADSFERLQTQMQDRVMPLLLIVCSIPEDTEHWGEPTHTSLTLQNCCYWKLLQPDSTFPRHLRIPRSQLFNANVLDDLLTQQRNWICGRLP